MISNKILQIFKIIEGDFYVILLNKDTLVNKYSHSPTHSPKA